MFNNVEMQIILNAINYQINNGQPDGDLLQYLNELKTKITTNYIGLIDSSQTIGD